MNLENVGKFLCDIVEISWLLAMAYQDQFVLKL